MYDVEFLEFRLLTLLFYTIPFLSPLEVEKDLFLLLRVSNLFNGDPVSVKILSSILTFG